MLNRVKEQSAFNGHGKENPGWVDLTGGVQVNNFPCIGSEALFWVNWPQSVINHLRCLEESQINDWQKATLLLKEQAVKDPKTVAHQIRVMQLVDEIVKTMDLPKNIEYVDIETLKLAACLHDIGKMGIPMEIVNKAGKLTREERRIMKAHPRLGKIYLTAMDLPREVINIVFQYHEKLNGRGYPEKKRGKEISRGARILAVADAYDARCDTARSYHLEFLKPPEVLQDIIRHRYRWYDGTVVKALTEVVQNGFQLKEESLNRFDGKIGITS
ncbi:MAG: HD domain-containing protein [Patescibacteria group bacterium]|nr:HD domain-containing protein [Patescibacteria group bacterium]